MERALQPKSRNPDRPQGLAKLLVSRQEDVAKGDEDATSFSSLFSFLAGEIRNSGEGTHVLPVFVRGTSCIIQILSAIRPPPSGRLQFLIRILTDLTIIR
jgi:hypothetical protein